ncbi:hypothetical protein [Streptomyces sp. NPDC046925]|uniref:hypothetical protein n=1 Tax=Streptomyces sp. NPDC046925 TaxID=3155375 RepID=UPI0033D1CD4D
MPLTDTWVTTDEAHLYPARIAPAPTVQGRVRPGFTIAAVRQLAAHTARSALVHGPGSDQITVIEGAPAPVVLHIRWPHSDRGAAADASRVIRPDARGLYWIDGPDWKWARVQDGPPLAATAAAREAWRGELRESGRLMGEILRTRMPGATSCLVDLTTGFGRITDVEINGRIAWPTGTSEDGEEGYGPFDDHTLGEADEVMRKALDHGRDPVELKSGGWHDAHDSGLRRITFAPADAPATGSGPFGEARARATEARRQLIAEAAPYLVREVRAAVPGAQGLTLEPDPLHPCAEFTVDGGTAIGALDVPGDAAHRLNARLAGVFTPRPDHDDLIACGWTPTRDGSRLAFPAA